MSRYTDLAYEQDEDDGIFDLVIEDGDLAVTDGLEPAFLVSLFSDRRADESEVGDPRKRRGWIGDLVAENPRDRHGSGIWLYEQHRLVAGVAAGVRTEADQSLDWMVDEQLLSYVESEVVAVPASRQLQLFMTAHFIDGSVTSHAFVLADATRAGIIARL